MASKQCNVDSVVNERRLRPIYDRLDNGNNKKALQEADKVLKKHPTNQCARVLKALALLRLGKEDECQTIIDQVRSEVPCEDSTLQAMSICYREIHQPDKISEVYEAASKADPKNEELLTHLFMSYVRLGDFKKQHQSALALYKLLPKNPYYFWAVMSIVMQATQASDPNSKKVVLALAERMVLIFVKEGKIEAEQEIQLYLIILELQGKTSEMLNFLSEPLATRLSNVPQLKAKLLLKTRNFEEATKAYEKLILNEYIYLKPTKTILNKNVIKNIPTNLLRCDAYDIFVKDNWSHYEDYISAGLQSQTPTVCYTFLNELIADNIDKKIRAPQLARLELLKRARQQKLEFNDCTSVGNDMRQYFKQFGTKGCIVGDFRLYLGLLSDADQKQLMENIENDIGVNTSGYPSTIEQMTKHIHLEQLKRICGRHDPPWIDNEGRKNLVARLIDLYDQGNILCPVGSRLPTDFCPADSYILLAAHVLHQMWCETQEAEMLFKIIFILERGLITSPANFHIKILLVRAYLEAGLAVGADNVYSMLECKHVQLDSLGYLHVLLLAPLGHLSQAANCLDQTAKFFVSNYKDSADHLTFAYKYGSFGKIREFVELRERLEQSIHFAATSIDKMLLELSWCDGPKPVANCLHSMHVQPSVDSIKWHQLRDNRDLEVVVGWEPLLKTDQDVRLRSETFECMKHLAKVRNTILRILAAPNEADFKNILLKLSTELQTLQNEGVPEVLRKFKCNETDVINNIIVPFDAVERLREAYYSSQISLIAQLAEFLSTSSYPKLTDLLKSSPCLQPLSYTELGKPVSFFKFLLRASTCGETIAFVAIICIGFLFPTSGHHSLTALQSKPNISKKKNKNKSSKSENDTAAESQIWHEISQILLEKIQSLESILNGFEKVNLCTNLDMKDETANRVVKNAEESLKTSCMSLKSRLHNTQKLVNFWQS